MLLSDTGSEWHSPRTRQSRIVGRVLESLRGINASEPRWGGFVTPGGVSPRTRSTFRIPGFPTPEEWHVCRPTGLERLTSTCPRDVATPRLGHMVVRPPRG